MSGIILPFKNLRLRVGGFMLVFLNAFISMAQTAGTENVGIGTTKPDISAILDLTSNSKGLLIPRMTLAQRGNIKSPANGLMVYQTDFFSGFYFFDGTSWKGLYARSADGAAITAANPVATSGSSSENSWNVNGNTGLSSDINFLGTLDTTSLVFKVNNYRSGIIDYRFGNTYFGYRAGYRSHGFNSVALGAYALFEANLGLNNVAIGYQSLPSSKTGSDNVTLGSNTLYNNVTGSQNIAIGTQAGLRALGDGNVFLGYKAGVNEVGSNKLYIDNNFSTMPLIFGDFETGKVGINTKQPESALSIDSKLINISGLEFKQLTNNSPAGRPTQKVLSVDDKGRVILVRDSVGLGSSVPVSIPPSYWALKGSSIENSNTGDVILSNIRFKTLRTISPAIPSNSKVLTVDDNGFIVLARDSVGAATPNHWILNANSLSNSNNGKLILNGGIQLSNIKASNKAFNPYGKVLSVDDTGNLILVRDSVGTNSTIPVSTPAAWNISGVNIANSNTGNVYINNGLILSKLNSDSPTTVTAQKFLTVDSDGKVLLANTPVNNLVTYVSQWTASGDNISNANAGTVYVNNGLRAKKGIYLESGILEVNSAIENKSGLQFTQLKATNLAQKPSGKVLSVDDNGNVILVRDSVGTSSANPIPVSPSPWTLSDNTIFNNNTGRVSIKNGLTLPQITSETATSVNAQKFLTVDNAGNVILGNVVSSPTVTSPWAINGNDLSNSNSGRVHIGNGLSTKNGLIVESGNLEANGSIVLHQLKQSSPASKSSGKVLSVDENGAIILVRDSVATNVTNPIPVSPSPWTLSDNTIFNNNTGRVSIKNGLTLPQITSETATSVNAQKFLTVDNAGNVILGNVVVNTPTVSSPWVANGNDISNSNSGRIFVMNGLSSKNGLTVESGNFEANGGVVLRQFKQSSPALKSSGKVLSVDDNGNLILVKDSVGTSVAPAPVVPSSWSINGNNIANSNAGTVYINNGFVLSKLNSNLTPTVTTQKVLSVDTQGNVILVNTPSATTPVVNTELWKSNNAGGIFNTSTHGISILSNTDGKSGLQLVNLKAASTPGNSYGKVLSVDDFGNVILVNDAVGAAVSGTNTPVGWNIVDGRLHNTNNGKVVIGTGINSFPDGFQLFVKGGILTERVRVAVANSDRWADYVFKKGYQLMPLNDVEKFINYHQHLPNVPSAEEMAKNGMDVMETSAKLMEKLEELTLYMIEANKKIEALEAKMKNLEKVQNK
ncbi:hypothetical protein [Emticicia sp. SJ17W-69]|uniref:hypothetical protein n=1 Tax=Emticicia sp. SJ17W-69 TaxID=3421657 RepID=UPI003EB97235